MFLSTTKLVSNLGTLLILSLLSQDFRYVAFVGNGFHGFRLQTWNIATTKMFKQKKIRTQKSFSLTFPFKFHIVSSFCGYCLKNSKEWLNWGVCDNCGERQVLPYPSHNHGAVKNGYISNSTCLSWLSFIHDPLPGLQGSLNYPCWGDQIWCKVYVEGFPLWSCSVWVGVIYNDPWIMGRS